MKIKKEMGAFEMVLLSFFKKMVKTTAATERHTKHFKQLLEDLETLVLTEQEKMGYHEVCLWVKGQL